MNSSAELEPATLRLKVDALPTELRSLCCLLWNTKKVCLFVFAVGRILPEGLEPRHPLYKNGALTN